MTVMSKVNIDTLTTDQCVYFKMSRTSPTFIYLITYRQHHLLFAGSIMTPTYLSLSNRPEISP